MYNISTFGTQGFKILDFQIHLGEFCSRNLKNYFNMEPRFRKALPLLAVVFIVAVATLPVITGCSNEKSDDGSDFNYEEYVRNENLSVVKKDDGKISIKNIITGETTIKDIKVDWTSSSGVDTLAVFCADNKRGYFNVHTGKIVIEPKYRRAWNFSDGLAAVQLNGYIGFLDSKGNVAIGFNYPYYGNPLSSFLFKKGYCVVADSTGKCGVINKKGDWTIEPVYDNVEIFEEYAIVTKAGLRAQMLFDGTLLNSYVLDEISQLTFTQEEYYANKEGEICTIEKTIDTGMFFYRVGGRVGLMDANCRRLTEPLYTRIRAVSKTMYRAYLLDGYSEVILNAKGEIMK